MDRAAAVIHDDELDADAAQPPNLPLNTSHPFIGVSLAFIAAFLVGISFILQKKGLINMEKKSERNYGGKGSNDFAYLKQWMWWCGMLTMATGEVITFLAYSIAPAILITPLGALRVIVSAILASIFLKEKLNLQGKIGVLLSLLGSVMIIIHAPKHEKVKTFDQVEEHFTDSAFLLYCTVLLGITTYVVIHMGPKRGKTDVMVYITVCNITGALCVLCGKGLGIGFKDLGNGDMNVLNEPLFWLLVVGNIGGILIQIVYLNKALAIFNTAMITPIKYVFTNVFLVFGSILLFQEFVFMSGEDVVGMLCGFLTVVTGVTLLTRFKDTTYNLAASPKR